MKPERKYELLNLKEITNNLEAVVNETAAVIQYSSSTTRQLLHHFKWNSALLIERFFEAIDESKWFESMGILPEKPRGASKNLLIDSGSVLDCGICFEKIDEGDGFGATACRHKYCRPCLSRFCLEEIKSLRKCEVFCPQLKCNASIDDEFIIDKQILQLLRRLRCNKFVEFTSTVSWCNGPECEGIAVMLSSATEIDLVIECICGHSFCFNCQQTPHEPLPCFLDERWKAINSSYVDNGSSIWLTGNTKACTGCKMPVEKNGGCDHMTCVSCKTKFNWSQTSGTNLTAYKSSRFVVAKENYVRHKNALTEVDGMKISDSTKTLKRSRNLLANTYVLRFFVRDYEMEFMNKTIQRLEQDVSLLLDMLLLEQDATETIRNIIKRSKLLQDYVSGSIGDWNYNE